MTKENLTKLFSFKTLYLALLAFVILHLILLVFAYPLRRFCGIVGFLFFV